MLEAEQFVVLNMTIMSFNLTEADLDELVLTLRDELGEDLSDGTSTSDLRSAIVTILREAESRVALARPCL